MIQSAGLAETIDRKRKRLGKARQREDVGDEDGNSDDDDSDGAWKRVHQMKKHSERTEGTAEKIKGKQRNQGAPPPVSPHRSGAGLPGEPMILFLEQEYLAFRLGNPDTSTSSNSSNSDTDSPSSNYEGYNSDNHRSERASCDLFSTDDDDRESVSEGLGSDNDGAEAVPGASMAEVYRWAGRVRAGIPYC
ncbi:hypothetical protein Q9L58_009663 [Maublancomyces gigas]|uniref:Uncharacterized protein n=1 Tax=Discina gigas TaxID=1032678 RepID=A0ABR3G6R6_9PEZI